MSPVALSQESSYSIACIPADGIGPEVIDAGVEVLKTLSQTLGIFKLEFEDYDWSSKTFLETGKYIPDGGLEKLKKHDAILFGAVGAPGESTDNVLIWLKQYSLADLTQQTYQTTFHYGVSA